MNLTIEKLQPDAPVRRGVFTQDKDRRSGVTK